MDWDAGRIAEDLQAVSSLGMDHIRVFPIWPVFQPNANYVSEVALDRLAELLDIADRSGLDVQVAALNGFLSGFRFMPAWKKNRSMFTNADVVRAEKLLIQSMAERIGNHRRFLGFDLGNEVNVLHKPEGDAPLAQMDAWQTDLLTFCADVAPNRLHVNGIGLRPWLTDAAFTRDTLATTGGASILHPYIYFSGALSLYGAMDTGCIHLLEYCVELAKAFSRTPDRPIWIQETGVSPSWMPEHLVPEHVENSVRSVVGCGNLLGITWWCSHDVDKTRLTEFDECEYSFGLLDNHNSIKPLGECLRRLINEYRHEPPKLLTRNVGIVMPEDLYSRQHAVHPSWILGQKFMSLIEDGVRPSVVPAGKVSDQAYLAERGINELVEI